MRAAPISGAHQGMFMPGRQTKETRMKKSLIAILTTTALLGLGGTAMAQTGTTAPDAASVDPLNDAGSAPDAMLATDQLASAKHKLKFKIKGVQTDDDGDGESNDDGDHGGEGHDGGHGEGADDNG
jgi:hypothetical protein